MRLAQIAALPLMASTSVRTRSKEIAIARSASQDTRRGRVAALLIAVALLLAVVAAASNRQIGAHMSGVGTARTAALRAAIDDSLADLDSGLTPRAAVIRSYVRMEEVLARHQLPHRAAEAPREYLARARRWASK